jgi:membrane associated rhomboid family serine protease
MLYDRSYMRAQESPSIERASAVTILLVITIGAFVLEQIINVSFPGTGNGGSSFIKKWFVLSAENFKELKVWTVISYAFLHSSNNIWHIVGNMLSLFFIGRMVEPLLGKRSFFMLYFSGAIIGGIAYLFFHLNDQSSVVGASAAVCAILAFFCMRFPERQITLLLFFIIPLTVKPKWIFWGFLGISTYLLLFSEIQGTNGVAHSAHLGGFLTGVVYYRYIYNRQMVSGNIFGQTRIEAPQWFKRRRKVESKISYQVNRPTQNRDGLQKEVDRILDKINTSGFSSLNETEKATLEKAKELLNR